MNFIEKLAAPSVRTKNEFTFMRLNKALFEHTHTLHCRAERDGKAYGVPISKLDAPRAIKLSLLDAVNVQDGYCTCRRIFMSFCNI